MTGVKILHVGGYLHLHILVTSTYKNMVDLKNKCFYKTKHLETSGSFFFWRGKGGGGVIGPDKSSAASLVSTSQPLCTFPHTLASSILISWFLPRPLRLDVLLEFLHAEVAVLVELWQRLLYPQGCEAGLWTLVPALLHDLHYSCQDLQQAMAGWKNKCLYSVGYATIWEGSAVFYIWKKVLSSSHFTFCSIFVSRECLACINPLLVYTNASEVVLWCVSLSFSPDASGVCCADWASADLHTPPSSSPQSWDLKAPGQRRAGDILPKCLKRREEGELHFRLPGWRTSQQQNKNLI